jgi:hypothetical protein
MSERKMNQKDVALCQAGTPEVTDRKGPHVRAEMNQKDVALCQAGTRTQDQRDAGKDRGQAEAFLTEQDLA